eukprot:TRINITY_DN4474_c0_g1_i1.p1 TRINITY_DN4474_c0_g1~~TRINITY_DN4474_c0_g1_i1.p1  ORF type:complete len:520 (+),score=127.04 TRINITY_DN4474_c0_g1_i1:72-1631(+)
MAYFRKELVVPKNHLLVKPNSISPDDVWRAASFGWKGLATVPLMGAARAMSDLATLLMQDVLPQDARNPKELAAWIQEDAEDFSQTIMSRLKRVDWSKVQEAAAFGLLRGAMDQLVLVLLRSTIAAILSAPNAEEGLASFFHRPLIELRQKLIGGWFMYAFPGVSEGEIRMVNGDEFNLEPEPFAFSWLFKMVRSDAFAYFEHTFAKYALMNLAPSIVQLFVEFYHLMMGRQSISQLMVRMGDQFSRRSGATFGAALTMGMFAPMLPYSGKFRNIALLAIEYTGQYLGSMYAQGFSRKFLFGTPEPLLDDAAIAKQKLLGKKGRVGSRSALSGSENGGDDLDVEDMDDSGSFIVPKQSQGRPARRPAQEVRRSQNGRQTPPSRSRTPVSNGDYASPSRTPPPQFEAADPPARATSPVAAPTAAPVAAADGAPQSRAAMRLNRIRQQQQGQQVAQPQPRVAAPVAANAEDPIIPRSPSPIAAVVPQPESEPERQPVKEEAPSASPFEEPLGADDSDDDDE